MLYLICLFFPSFIGLKQLISSDDNRYSIFLKYIYINIVVNLLGFLIVWLYSKSNSLIDDNIMTIPFFVKFLFVTSCISFFVPKIYLFIKNNVSIKIERK